MELFLIYLWLKLDAIQLLFGFVAAVGGLAFVFALMVCAGDGPMPHRKKCASAIVFCVLTAVALPSSNQVAIMIGANYAMKLADSAEGQKVMMLIRKKANQLLDEQLAQKEKK